ncbi:SDR family NAD(P)-dependent oxidoreductase [Planosporangium thailandense]|uniref:SDR family NAD(P)-dependent oxidoreductase n=1 Tax=Planosporangium thailandense TaxID=765197 RepID=A0ABX0Y415_9ACTN|nr:type I polyketide synthase [Planosporangium thailandense]NJC73093.1 SDR family NAD(P)-dependent oxidoreductase [Planosporangium thailandense]
MSGQVAVVGYACRVPGADDVAGLWDIVVNGRDVVTRASTNVGATSGDRVHAYGVLSGYDLFDEAFFGYSPREAAEIDPQQRLLLECAVEALEDACVRPDRLPCDVGVYASVGLSGYLLNTWQPASGAESLPALLGGDGHYAATRIAYKLGLTGPAVSVGSACSSSLLAVHLAAQAILGGECEVALAGGMDVEVPQPTSYLYQDGGILSNDGVCRPFDRHATGTVFGSGGGLVVLAAWELAQARGWPVRAVLRGSAANNDGDQKASFTAPRAGRQADVIAQALAVAGVDPAEVTYVECHGTGTDLGDRSEINALRQVFGATPPTALGSVKANLGHLRVGAGVVGLIKACEVVRRGVVPPCANLDDPTPTAVDLGARLPSEPLPIPLPPAQRVAGVSSFGFGGTNVHVVVSGHAAGTQPERRPARGSVLVTLSSAGPDSCLASAGRLAAQLRADPSIDLADVAHTLHEGRTDGAYRYAVVADDRPALADALEGRGGRVAEAWSDAPGDVLVLLPGQGTDLGPLAAGMYGWEQEFTRALDTYWAQVRRVDPTVPGLPEALAAPRELRLPAAHGLHVSIGLAVVDQLRSRGLTAAAFAGYSLGEYAAAAAAGALAGSDAVRLVVERGRILAAGAPAGDMILVDGERERLAETVPNVPVAIRVSARRHVLAVAESDIGEVLRRLDAAGLRHRRLDLGIPYHSPLLDPAARLLDEAAARTDLRADNRFLATAAASHKPVGYWGRHLAGPVDFTRVADRAAAMGVVAGCHVVDLSGDGFLARALTDGGVAPTQTVLLHETGHPVRESYLLALAQLWSRGIGVDPATPGATDRRLIPLVPRAFDRTRHAKDLVAERPDGSGGARRRLVRRERSLARWAYQPSWRMKRRGPVTEDVAGQRWLVFVDADGLAAPVVGRLRQRGVDCELVGFGPAADGVVTVTPGDEASVKAMVRGLGLDRHPIDRIVHLSCAGDLPDAGDLAGRMATIERELDLGFYPILHTLQEMATQQGARHVHLDIVARGIHALVPTSEQTIPERALLLGPALVIPQDFAFMSARTLDVGGLLDPNGRVDTGELLAELLHPAYDKAVTFGQGARWVRGYERDVLPEVPAGETPLRLRDRGVYLITGGLGGIGMTLAEYLVRTCRARLILTGLETVPDTAWDGDPASLPADPLLAERVRRIRKLVELGGEVLAVRCDAADSEQTRALFAQIEKRFGELNGVVHAAGVFETQRAFRGLDDTSREDCARRLRPKVDGTVVLSEFIRGRKLDFVLMQSSLSAQLGGLGFYAYTAGNAFMDAFAERHRNDDLPWMSVNWDGWIFRERDDDTQQSVIAPSFASPDFGVVAEIAVRPSEGAEIYARLMQLTEPHQILISTADFEARVAQWVDLTVARHDGATGPEAAPTSDPAGSSDERSDDIELEVARIWRDILGRDDVGPDSNFFALGGDSLLGVALAYRLSQHSGAVLSVITLFENPTVAAMAAEIRRLRDRRPAPAAAGGK